MSANNQTLVKEHKGRWYVFTNVMAESWCELDENDEIIKGRDNELSLKKAVGQFGIRPHGGYDSRDEAFEVALELDQDDEFGGTEYGVQFNRLCKDDSEVKIIE